MESLLLHGGAAVFVTDADRRTVLRLSSAATALITTPLPLEQTVEDGRQRHQDPMPPVVPLPEDAPGVDLPAAVLSLLCLASKLGYIEGASFLEDPEACKDCEGEKFAWDKSGDEKSVDLPASPGGEGYYWTRSDRYVKVTALCTVPAADKKVKGKGACDTKNGGGGGGGEAWFMMSDHTREYFLDRSREQFLRSTYVSMEESLDGIWQWNTTKMSLYLSPRYCRKLGYANMEDLDNHGGYIHALHEEDQPLVESLMSAYPRTKHTHSLFLRYYVQGCRSNIVYVHCRGHLLRLDKWGFSPRVVGHHTNVTTQECAFMRLACTARSKMLFLGQMSRDMLALLDTNKTVLSPRRHTQLVNKRHSKLGLSTSSSPILPRNKSSSMVSAGGEEDTCVSTTQFNSIIGLLRSTAECMLEACKMDPEAATQWQNELAQLHPSVVDVHSPPLPSPYSASSSSASSPLLSAQHSPPLGIDGYRRLQSVPLHPLARTASDDSFFHDEAEQAEEFIGCWRKQRLLGRGMCGEVYKAYNIRTKQVCALKCVNLSLVQNKYISQQSTRTTMLDVVKNEVLALTLLAHGNIVRLYDAFQSGNMYYLCMELVRGDELSSLIPPGGMSEKAARHIMRQVVVATAYCHFHGVVHGDLKMENILVKDGRVKVIDFGFSHFLSGNKAGARGSPVRGGSRQYAPPESEITLAWDVWALGVISFVMLTGVFPFKTPSDLWSKGFVLRVPETLSDSAIDLMEHLLEVNHANRPPIVNALDSPWLLGQSAVPKDVPHWTARRQDVVHTMSL